MMADGCVAGADCSCFHGCRGKHLSINKFSAILQTTISYAFSWNASYICTLKINWSIFHGFDRPISQIPQCTCSIYKVHHSEQKYAHFCSEWCIAGYGIGASWDLWIRSIDNKSTLVLVMALCRTGNMQFSESVMWPLGFKTNKKCFLISMVGIMFNCNSHLLYWPQLSWHPKREILDSFASLIFVQGNKFHFGSYEYSHIL